MSSPISMLIKNTYYKGIELLKRTVNFSYKTYDSSNYSPYKYLLESYKLKKMVDLNCSDVSKR